jgi:hypothetical protein
LAVSVEIGEGLLNDPARDAGAVFRADRGADGGRPDPVAGTESSSRSFRKARPAV